MEILAKLCARSVLACLILVLTLCSLGICQQECDTPVELGFLVDRSGSIDKQNFEKVKSFVLNVIAGFDVSKNGTHIGIISYSSDAKTIISFDQFDDPNFDYEKLNDTIRDGLASPEGGTTRIDLALKTADEELFSDITKYRSFVPKILLILTDGQQTKEGVMNRVDLAVATRKLSRKGVEVFVLGVGDNVNIPEMLVIAGDKDENVYLADNFDELETVVEGLVNSFCKVCKRNVDIVFLIPTVSNALQDIKAIVNAMLLTFGIRKYEGVHVAIITCAEQGKIVLTLNENYMRAEIQNILKSLQMAGRTVILDECLREASNNMFDVRGGVRNGVDKYMVVFDDGSSLFRQPAVNNSISTLKSQGITVMGMAVGSSSAAQDKMRTISHVPKSVWLKQIRQREVQNAAFFARSVSEVLCKEKPGKCPYTDLTESCEDGLIFDQCDLDSDRASPCPDDMICCEHPCGRSCVSPMPDCFSSAEIALLIDTAGTQGDDDNESLLKKFKTFSKELVHGFSIAETAARVAVVTYSNEGKVNMDLESGQSFQTVKGSIDDIELSNTPNRNLEEALRFTDENIFSLKGGLRKIGRRVLVVLSSGESTSIESSLSNVAQSLTDKDVEIWAVHGGTDSSSYFSEIVSQSSRLLSSLDEDSEDFQRSFVMSVCHAKEGICRNPVCQADRADQCRQDYLCPGQEKCCLGACRSCVETRTVCRYPMDLAFILQNSVSESDFSNVKSFMKEIMDALEVGRTNTYIGVITFNQDAKIELEFSTSDVSNANRKRKVLMDAIDMLNVSPDASTAGVVEAFELANNRLFTTDAGSHPNEIRNLIFISDGKIGQAEDMIESARKLRFEISNIFPFSLTDDLDVNTLLRTAAPDGEKNVYLTSSYGALTQYTNKIAVDLCKRGANPAVDENPVVLVRGPPGTAGSPGNEGGEGEPGPLGPKGAPGDFGTTGIRGGVGKPGNPGGLGLHGLVGPPGEMIIERSGDKGPVFGAFVNLRNAEQNFSTIIATEITKNPIPGTRGPKGLKGMRGPAGGVGELGGIGKHGLCGGEGTIGATGRVGLPGMQGNRGIAGNDGEVGVVGQKGELGEGGNKGTKGESGPRGDRGERGIMGDDGEVGDPGPSGLIGDEGSRGKKGERGEPGVDGDAGFKGFIGAQGGEGQRGITGKQGKQGPPGPIGFRGIPGPPGFQGTLGFYGTVGEPGSVGDIGDAGTKGKSGGNGKRGQDGPSGKPGEPGDPGSKGLPGFTGQRGEGGANGDIGANGENGEMGELGANGANGRQGDRGLTGEKGIAGLDAPPGSEGRMGVEGQSGVPGGRGLDGPPGPKGEVGPDGRPGPPGHTARPGYVGTPGGRGEKGERGDSGLPGTRGIPGQKGFPGEPGLIGFPGQGGTPGRPGNDGLYGSHGSSGDPGPIGIPGSLGPPGLQGRPGQEGEAGPRGVAGEKGYPGPPGFPGPPGVAAPPGPNGFPGPPGEGGRSGTPGSYGFSGRLGEDGLIGDKGPKGSPGIRGTPGPPGSRGLKGSQGPVGDKGFTGRSGGDGSRGSRGDQGPKGTPGMQGDDGGRGREGDRGPSGPVGGPGIDGTKGEPGRRGKLGRAGNNGDPGNPGGKGEAGADGVKGDKGAIGELGIPGKPGEPGRDGIPGVAGAAGALGPGGFQGTTGSVGLPGSDGSPGQKGPEGDAGQPGIDGANGGPGFPGNPGALGPRGERGQKGTPGTGTLPGERGSRGSQGFQGSLGRPGTPGASGDKGEKGDKGFPGDEGELGEKGLPGIPGQDGEEGEKGDKGSKGEQGEQGELGETGIEGVEGPPGDMGDAGEPALNGLPGVPGEKGTTGQKGDQGVQGPKGASGNSGKPGLMGTEGPVGGVGDSSTPGPKGIQGDTGPPGLSVDGTVGPPGSPGPAGATGLPGEKGEEGQPGSTGPKGIGIRGENGTVGVIGEPGTPGMKGAKGDIGRAGRNAVAGRKGETGKVGVPGEGVKGDKGDAGPPGEVGMRGPPGATVDGNKGEAGNRGPKGVRGLQGPPGPPGLAGVQAVSFNGSTILIRHNSSYSEKIAVDMNSNLSRRYFSIQHNLALYKKPNGSQLFPAISCAVLHSHYPEVKSGRYWVDPNQGSYEDAEEAYCDFENNATCLEPVQNKIENKKWFSGSDGYRWLTKELDGLQNVDQFNYTFDDGQLQMLQLHSSKAWQRVTYNCLNSVPWNNVTQNAIKLQGDDDLEFHIKMPRKLRPVVIEDNCQTKDNTWRKTVLEVHTKTPANLPMRDIAVYDVGDDGEEFGLELGQVCFAP